MCLWLDGRFAPIRAAWQRAFAGQRRAPACDPSGPPLRGAIMRLARRCQWPSPARNLGCCFVIKICAFGQQQRIVPVAVGSGERHLHQSADGAIPFDFDVTVEIGFKEADIAEQYRPALCRRRAEDEL